MNRRKFLKIAGSSAVILAAGSTGFLATRTPTDALTPWQEAGVRYTDPMKNALSYAILAPNPHNRQPWLVDLHTSEEATLHCDLDRLLPETDPYSRQIMIGLGCFLELFSLAATQQGYKAEFTYFPEGSFPDNLDKRPVAKISLKKEAFSIPDPLFNHITQRHTNREPYDVNQPIPDETLNKLHHLAADGLSISTVNSGPLLDDLRLLTRDALVTETMTPQAHKETVDLMRFGRSEIEANPDGISLGGPFLETLHFSGILTRENMLDPNSGAFKTGLNMINDSAMSAMGFAWITTPDNSRLSQLKAGRQFIRLHLQTTADGLALQPMSQALQEYPAMVPYLNAVHEKLTSKPKERVQMLVRLGYGKRLGPSPRWPLETRIKNT